MPSHELKALIVAQHKQLTTQEERILTQNEQLASRDAEIGHLKLLIAKLRRLQEVHRKKWVARSSNWNCGWSNWKKAEAKNRRRHVMSSDKLHGDDTPVPVLAPGLGKTKTGRLWTYVRDDRPAGDGTPPAVWFCYSPDRKGEHPV